jgi:hypothetical protein
LEHLSFSNTNFKRILLPLAWFVPTHPILLFHKEKMLEARVRLTSRSISEIANPSQIHSHSRKEAAKGQQVLAKARECPPGQFNFADVVRIVSAARFFSLNSEVEKSSFVLIVVLVTKNPFHALVRNSSCKGLLTQQVNVRVSGDCPLGDLR